MPLPRPLMLSFLLHEVISPGQQDGRSGESQVDQNLSLDMFRRCVGDDHIALCLDGWMVPVAWNEQTEGLKVAEFGGAWLLLPRSKLPR